MLNYLCLVKLENYNDLLKLHDWDQWARVQPWLQKTLTYIEFPDENVVLIW